LHPTFAIFARFHSRYPACQIDHQLVTLQYIRALRHDHRTARHRDRIGFHVEDPLFPSDGLVLLRDDAAASRFQSFDALLPTGARRGRLHRLGLGIAFRTLLVEDHQRFAAHARVTLLHADVTTEGRLLLLVANLQSRCFDMDRLIAILRKALQCIWRSLTCRLRAGGRAGNEQRNNEQEQDEWFPHSDHCVSGFAGGGWLSIMSMTTPPWKRTTSPESKISSRLALSVPCNNFTSTGCSDTMLPLRMSISASLKRPW